MQGEILKNKLYYIQILIITIISLRDNYNILNYYN